MEIKKFAKSKHRDKLKGGKADKLKPSDFDKKQLAIGTQHEMEHTNNRATAKEIAMDHLAEDKNYYKKLKKLEKSDPKSFVKNFKKSYDWKEVQVTVPSGDHAAAEQSIPEELINRLRNEAVGEVSKINFEKGILTLSKTAEGLYSGFFQDIDGQIVDKYEPTTLEIIGKNLVVKNLFAGLQANTVAQSVDSPKEAEPHKDAVQDLQLIASAVSSALAEHNNVYHQGQAPFEPINSGKGSLKIKYGGLELELKKSIQDFVKSFKSEKSNSKSDIKKALGMWRRNSAKQFNSDLEAAKALIQHWDTHGESFNQILFAIEQLKKK